MWRKVVIAVFVMAMYSMGVQSNAVPDKMLTKSEYACTHYNTAYELQDKLFGGTPAGAGEFPHMAALFTQHRRSDDTQFSCGGTIISNRFILTAAHCLNDGEMKYARVGEIDISRNLLRLENPDYNITQTFVHPDYNNTNMSEKHDIALVKVDRKIQFIDLVWPACLNTKPNGNLTDTLIATGWGICDTCKGRHSNVLLKANVTEMRWRECRDMLKDRFDKYQDRILESGVTDLFQLCAYDPEGKNYVGQGDSGGPLQVAEPNSLHRIIGITSYGIGYQNGMDQRSTYPSVFTRVSAYIKWIESIVDDWPEMKKQ